MKLITLLLVSVCYGGYAQKFTIKGTIKDRNSGENLIGANVYNPRTTQGTATNEYGFFSITLAADTVLLRASHVGFETIDLVFKLTRDTTLKIELSNTLLREVTISSDREEKIQESSAMGKIDIPVTQIKAMPAFLGEVDVLKVLQLLPGVQSGSEGSSGLYVRGGGPDQNLMLLDGVPVYNASHLFGFFSVFNADAINHVELTKGGFPARYGGRLSSVVDIRLKEGNTKELKGEGSIGLISSKLTIEGPINKKTSFLVSARRTYLDLLARPFMSSDKLFGYYFYDLNLKINHRLNDRNWLYFSMYAGEDKGWAKIKKDDAELDFKSHVDDNFSLKWGNIITALRWNHIISDKLFGNLTATYSRYRFNVFNQYSETNTVPSSNTNSYSNYVTEYQSGIRDYALKLDFDYLPNPNHYIRFGGQAIQHLFTPGILNYQSITQPDTTVGAQRIFTQEYALYAEDDFSITNRLKINWGVHASGSSVNNKFYRSLQPRISGRYLLNDKVALKASYAQMTQYIHLLTNAGIGLPTDLWVPATPSVGPERSSITSAGVVYEVNSKYELSVEGYYKKMTGLIEYKNGASYLDIDKDWQTKVEIGDGESHGAEIFLQKKTGRFSGWIGYTLSWTNRTFANLNNGKTFPYRYDRRHDISVALMYKLKENRDISITWVYGTGNAVSLPVSQYQSVGSDLSNVSGSKSISYYDSRNGYRMNAYHRLDISYNWTKRTSWGERTWSLAIYNVYNHKNPFFINRETDNGNQKFVQYSLFPVIPAIAFRFKF